MAGVMISAPTTDVPSLQPDLQGPDKAQQPVDRVITNGHMGQIHPGQEE